MKTTSLLARASHSSAAAVRRTAVTCSISAVLCLGLLIVGGTLHSVTATAGSAEVCGGYAACSGNGYTTHGYENASGASYWTMDAGNECTNYVAYVESTV
jgi:hypothetical protein